MIRTRALAIMIAFMTCMPLTAKAECGLPAALDDLVSKLRQTMFATVGASRAYGEELERLVDEIDREKLTYALNSLDLAGSRGVIDYLIQEAQTISAQGFVPDRDGLQKQIRVYDKLAKDTCRKAASEGRAITKPNGISQIDMQSLSNSRASHDGTVEPPYQSFFFLALLAPAVVGLLAVLAGGRLAYQWISAFTFSHRSCKIAASLECGLDLVDGHITILGKKGCRFQPESDDGFEQLEWLDDFEDCIIVIGPNRLFGSVDGLHGTFAVFFFENPIKDELLSVLMHRSSVPPKYVRRSTPKSKQKNTKGNAPRPILQNT